MQPVVEFLTFSIERHELDTWLEIEHNVWTVFLKQQPGFLRKEMWFSETEPNEVHAVIWWQSLELWKQITPEQCAQVDEKMGTWFRNCTMRTWKVLKTS